MVTINGIQTKSNIDEWGLGQTVVPSQSHSTQWIGNNTHIKKKLQGISSFADTTTTTTVVASTGTTAAPTTTTTTTITTTTTTTTTTTNTWNRATFQMQISLVKHERL